jgi:hypothetical protein
MTKRASCVAGHCDSFCFATVDSSFYLACLAQSQCATFVTASPACDTCAIDVRLEPMAAMMRFKAAAVHAAPVYMNKAATIRKTVGLIEQAAAKDVKLLVFPETFIPGYPVPAAERIHVSGRALTLDSILQSAIRHCSRSAPSQNIPRKASLWNQTAKMSVPFKTPAAAPG